MNPGDALPFAPSSQPSGSESGSTPPVGPAVPADRRTGPARPPKAVLLSATVLLSGAVLYQVPPLWNEWQALQAEWDSVRLSEPLGYQGISPNPTYARPPQPWAVTEGDSLRLWSDWVDGDGHRWFHVRVGDLDPKQLSHPIGRDVVRAIDTPITEVGDSGRIWKRLQPETPIVSLTVAGTSTAYPLLLLSKVEVVNDNVGGRPVLVVHTPFRPEAEAVEVFDPVVDGQTVHLGLSGHFLRGPQLRPLLYDRESESLWLVDDDGLRCVAGARKGVCLRHLGDRRPVPWSTWSEANPRGRLVVGAERSSHPEKPRNDSKISWKT